MQPLTVHSGVRKLIWFGIKPGTCLLNEISVYYYFFPISYHSYLLVQIYQNFCLLSYRFKFSDTCLFYDFGRTTFSLKSEPDLTRGTSILEEVRNVEISGPTQQLPCSKYHDFSSRFSSNTFKNQLSFIIFECNYPSGFWLDFWFIKNFNN